MHLSKKINHNSEVKFLSLSKFLWHQIKNQVFFFERLDIPVSH
jgi:hypothetical protein